ncbi:MAG TPA: FAD-dependent oxidoreductase [Ensifer sp.]|nr:FAD-dependent oxidoreductase [Ensifer sp.]
MGKNRVVVIGAGVAGAAAAIAAAKAGSEVVLLDKDLRFGGTARRAGGGFCVAGTASQRQRGIVDSPELALSDLLKGQDDLVHKRWARFYFRAAERHVHDALVGLGVEIAEVLQFERDSTARWHYPGGGGASLADRLGKAVQSDGRIECRLGFSLVGLRRAEGTGAHLTFRSSQGDEHGMKAGAVVIATGGFGQNWGLLRSAAKSPRNFLSAGGEQASGDLLPMLSAAGATLDGLDRVYFYPFITADFRNPSRGVAIRGLDKGIWLNASLERFLDETTITFGQSAAEVLMRQEHGYCWAIVDAEMTRQVAITDHYREAGTQRDAVLQQFVDNSPDVVQADTLADLAARMGVCADALLSVVDGWNRLAGTDMVDPATGRRFSTANPLQSGPFMAVRLQAGARKTLGGVVTDLKCRVLDDRQSPIPGLYAAGEVCGFAGGSITGRKPLEGMMVGVSFFAGVIAGRQAARQLQRNPG